MSEGRNRRFIYEENQLTDTSILFNIALANIEQLYKQLCADLRTIYEERVRSIKDLQTMLSQIADEESQRTAADCMRTLQLKPKRGDAERVKSAVVTAFSFTIHLRNEVEARARTARFWLKENPLLQAGGQLHRSSKSSHESLSISSWRCVNCTMENSASQSQCRFCGFAP